MRHWPNTLHWQNLVFACKHTSGAAWRTAGAALLGCDKHELRAQVDRNMHPDQVRKIYKLLTDHLYSHADELMRRSDEANYAAAQMKHEAKFAAQADFDLDAWMRESEPPCSDIVRQHIDAAITALLEEA